MMCDNCKQNDAVITLTQPTPSGVVNTLHLCEKCAAERGVEPTSSIPKTALGTLMLNMHKQTAPVPIGTDRCAFCGSSLRDFKDTERLGCARCYTTFEGSLRDLLRRLHGNSKHVGKSYQAPDSDGAPMVSLRAELQDRLKRAVESEQFELAAKLRDQIKASE